MGSAEHGCEGARTFRTDIFSPPRMYLCPLLPLVMAATAAAATSSTWHTHVPPVDGMMTGQSVIIVLRLPAVTSEVSFGPYTSAGHRIVASSPRCGMGRGASRRRGGGALH